MKLWNIGKRRIGGLRKQEYVTVEDEAGDTAALVSANNIGALRRVLSVPVLEHAVREAFMVLATDGARHGITQRYGAATYDDALRVVAHALDVVKGQAEGGVA